MKACDIVTHPTYGIGTVRAMRKMGREAYVEFRVGVMLHCPTHELRLVRNAAEASQIMTEQANDTTTADAVIRSRPDFPLHARVGGSSALASHTAAAPELSLVRSLPTQPSPEPKQKISPTFVPVHTPDHEHFQARQIIEALRLGVVPRFKIDEFTVGFRAEKADIRNAMDETEALGGDVRAIVGEYGAGKSHLFQWASFEALQRGYLVANASLDIFETPPSKPQRIYNALIKSLKYPNRAESGSLAPLFESFSDDVSYGKISSQMQHRHPYCPLHDALLAYRRSMRRNNRKDAGTILSWIAGERTRITDIRDAAGRTVAQLRSYTTVADQYCYLLSAIGWLARQAGYKGLVALVDESEHYSLLTTQMKQRADVFFQGMIYSVLGDRQTRIMGCQKYRHSIHCGLPHGGHEAYPFSYAPDAGLLFMFAATESAISLDYESWLDKERVRHLQSRLSAREIEELLARIYVFHRRAYSYDRKEDFVDVGVKLIGLYEAGIFNLRELIRYSTEVFDLLYAHPDYLYDTLAREIDRAFA